MSRQPTGSFDALPRWPSMDVTAGSSLPPAPRSDQGFVSRRALTRAPSAGPKRRWLGSLRGVARAGLTRHLSATRTLA